MQINSDENKVVKKGIQIIPLEIVSKNLVKKGDKIPKINLTPL